MEEKSREDNLYTIAFYNVENLFDIANDPKTLDDDFTPLGRNKWNIKRYNRKLDKMSTVISQIGLQESGYVPAIIGLAEVENRTVVDDLISRKHLKDHDYGIVHFNSPDERGVDVTLLYRKSIFELLHAENKTLFLKNEEGERDFTRDVLLVRGKLKGELIHILVNHWPSRRSGTDETEVKRIKAAQLVGEIISNINAEYEEAKIIIMGDFNDDPTDVSVKEHLLSNDFYNPFESIFQQGRGTLNHNGEWHLFDQIIISQNFMKKPPFIFNEASIFDKNFLKEWKGKRKGNPFRTYIGKWHQGGYSDHLPVYMQLKKVKTIP
ncbi:MAG: endonuclease [Flavobacteriaceae bacterium]|nr:endonuclease [Flavobacteriaceae bacterium]